MNIPLLTESYYGMCKNFEEMTSNLLKATIDSIPSFVNIIVVCLVKHIEIDIYFQV